MNYYTPIIKFSDSRVIKQSLNLDKILNNIPIDKKMLSSKSLSILDPRSDYKWDKFSTKCDLTESMNRHDEV